MVFVCLFVCFSFMGWRNVSLSLWAATEGTLWSKELHFLAHFLALGTLQSKLPSTVLEQEASWVTFLSE